MQNWWGHVCETFKIYGGNTTETLGCILEWGEFIQWPWVAKVMVVKCLYGIRQSRSILKWTRKIKIKDGEEPAQIKGGGTREAKGESSPYSP